MPGGDGSQWLAEPIGVSMQVSLVAQWVTGIAGSPSGTAA